LHSPWVVALAVLALAVMPVLAALSAYREQTRRAEALLFERSADIITAQLRLQTSRQTGWLASLRARLSNRSAQPTEVLDQMFAPGTRETLGENYRALGYGALENGRVVLRWLRSDTDASVAELGEDLLASPATAQLLSQAMRRPAMIASVQHGPELLIAMTVAESTPREPSGWLIAWWDLDAMCADARIGAAGVGRSLTAQPADGEEAAGRMIEIGEGGAKWRIEVGKGPEFDAIFPHVSERAFAFTGGGCAILLALLAGFATRAAGLRAALEGERDLVRMKNHLLHSVSHEFRTPLSVILSGADLLENYGARLSPERRASALGQIRDSTVRMSEMVDQVLLLSRIEANRLPIGPQAVDIASFARELAREIDTASHASCPVHVTAPDSLDATLDRALLRGVLGNLLSNAVKYSPDAAPIEFIVERQDGLRFTIRDSGRGIAADDLPRVCEPFFRAASAGEIPGAGLGLTIAAKCAALLGGTLSFESEEGQGTTATLTLPAV